MTDGAFARPGNPWARRVGVLVRDVVEAVALAVVLFLVLQLFIQNTVVEGQSMQPNFVDREHLLVSKLAYRLGEPVRGDVVVFHAPGTADKDYIKRVIALPGETVELRGGTVYIDGAPIEEPWAPAPDLSDFGPYVVPSEHLFVLGDNRANSNDSRVFGQLPGTGLSQPAVPLELIVGRAWITLWPADRIGRVRAASPATAGG